MKLRGDAPANGDPVRPAGLAHPGLRGRVGQGRRRQVVGDGEPGGRAGRSAGLSVGVLDADIYGFSVPRMLGVSGKPTQVDQMIMPPFRP